MSTWVTILKDKERLSAELIKNELQSQGIEAVILDKVDHNYPFLGLVEIKVPENQAELAQVIVNEFRIDD
ncbi:MAG: DUF2007 domain-containing protein [Cytophagaceae bacterium]|nr:DUF2007 domain-containing protein [Cytophagaceae bacterium]MBK9510597.1 DUF2007 domain-containing protein [Cytophagaceae bacterium]MBK9934397.1 DUF2007 domain-containing protein [Cytophagaceae bacterium]MBL0300846.1 DUF2007 domain-containing protein [Cytophagaceae bacterium]MBL0327789.1 DUF2007 domain-containing protein [Cytophagaceae bacterium]